MDHQFIELQPEAGMKSVKSPQLLVFDSPEGHRVVQVHFMANRGVDIIRGEVSVGFGQIKLTCVCESASGAYTASVDLRKVEFRFLAPQGMSDRFEFSIRSE